MRNPNANYYRLHPTADPARHGGFVKSQRTANGTRWLEIADGSGDQVTVFFDHEDDTIIERLISALADIRS